MKKIKINLLAIIGMMVAVATLAFTAPKENDALALQWYTVEEPDPITGKREISESIDEPEGDCVATLTTNICAVQLDMTTPPSHFEDLDPNEIVETAGRP